MKGNYQNAGADYTGKTVSATKSVTLVPETLNIQLNRDPVILGGRFSVIITGRPSTTYYLWVNDTGNATLPVTEQPPSILASAPVIQDPPEGPFTIGSYQILNGNGRTLMDAVPPSILNKTLYYAEVITSSRGGTAVVEFQAWNKTRPDVYTIHAERGTLSKEVSVEVENYSVQPARPINPGKVIHNPRINTEVTTPDSSDFRRIFQGATIFIGEEGLNVTAALNQAHGDGATPYQVPAETKIGWWASAATITYSTPTKTIDLATRHSSLFVDPWDFVGYTGNWYLVDPDTGMADLTVGGSPRLVFAVQDPSLQTGVWDLDQNWDVTGMSVPHGERLTFQINTNMYAATINSVERGTVYRPDVSVTTPGFITLKVKNENGATYNFLYQNNTTSYNLTNQFVDKQPDYWSAGVRNTIAYWGTDLLDTDGNYFYPSGTYSAWAESTLNNMKANYQNAGADYTGKTVSSTATITLVQDTVRIEANTASVFTGTPFSVTVSGRPNASYYLWVNNTRSLDSSTGNRPPMISTGQEKVYMDNPVDASHGIHPIGDYLLENSNGTKIFQDVAQGSFARGNQYNSTRYYARILTTRSGTRTVQFETDSGTHAQDYDIRAEQIFDGQYKRDDVTVTVRKSASPAFVSLTPPVPWFRNTTINYTITGSNFEPGITSVIFRNKSGALLNASPQAAGSGVWLVTPARIYGRITIPANASSATPYNITISVQGGGKAVRELAVTVADIPKPTIASISSSGPYYLNTSVNYTITGTNFQPDKTLLLFRNRTGASLNATPANSGVQVITPTQIIGTIMIPPDAPTLTPYNVTVTTIDGGTGAKETAFTLSRRPAPTISTFVPASGSKNTTVAFTVTGTNFRTEPGYTNVSFVNSFTDATIYGRVTSVTPASITGTLAVSADGTGGAYGLTVATVDGGSTSRESALTIVSLPLPVISTINQTSGYRNTTVTFAIKGNYFLPDGGTFVRLYTSADGSAIPATLTNVTGTRITGTFRIPSNATTGVYRLDVLTVSGGSGGKLNAFAVKPLPRPQILSVSPAQSYRNRTFVLTVTGNYFEPDSGTIVDLTSPTGGVVLNISLINVTTTWLNGTVTIPADAPTTPLWKLNVTTIDGGLSTKASAVTVQSYPRPTFTSITPASGLNDTVVSFTVKGTNFQTGGTDITFWNRTGNTVLVPTIINISSTQLSGNISIPSHANQSWYVNISTVDGGTLSREKAFRVY